MDPIEKAIRAVEAEAGMRKRKKRGIDYYMPKDGARASEARKKKDEERLKKADEPWNKEWVFVWQGGAPQ